MLFPGLNIGTFFAGTTTLSPVLGFLPFLAFLCLTEKVPKPLISALPFFDKALEILSRTILTIFSTSF